MNPDLSKITESQIVKVDEKTAIKYSVVNEKIDLNNLKRELNMLGGQLSMPEPASKVLIDLGRMYHPYYLINRDAVQQRINEIEEILNG